MRKQIGRSMIAIGLSVMLTGNLFVDTQIPVKAATESGNAVLESYCGGFWLLQRGEKRPENFAELDRCNLSWGGWGKIKTEKQFFGNEEKVQAMVKEVPQETLNQLKDGEEIRWFASRQKGYRFQVYGEIVKKKKQRQPRNRSVAPIVMDFGFCSGERKNQKHFKNMTIVNGTGGTGDGFMSRKQS